MHSMSANLLSIMVFGLKVADLVVSRADIGDSLCQICLEVVPGALLCETR